MSAFSPSFILLSMTLAFSPAFAGTDFVVQSHAQVNSANIGNATRSQCTITASPNPVSILAAISAKGDVISAGLASPFYLTVRSPEILNKVIVDSTYYYANTVNTSLAPVYQGVVWQPAFSPYVGEYKSRYFQLPYGVSVATFAAHVDGPGGPASCTTSVTVVCHYQPPHCDTELNGSQSKGACWYPMNNPPYCDWVVCGGAGCWNRGADDGCFPADTSIRVADGKERWVSAITPGDFVWNPARRRLFKVKKITVGPEALPLVELSYRLREKTVSVRVTTKHPIPTQDGLKTAASVRAGDKILGSDGKYHAAIVHHGKALPPDNNSVFNFELDTTSAAPEDHMIEANGVMTGDLYLQQLGAGENKP